MGAIDYKRLFSADATWPGVLKNVEVFKIYPHFIGNAPDAELSELIAFLGRHHLKLARCRSTDESLPTE